MYRVLLLSVAWQVEFLYGFHSVLTKSVIVELKGLTPRTQNSAIDGDPEPVPSTCQPHNLLPHFPTFLLSVR